MLFCCFGFSIWNAYFWSGLSFYVLLSFCFVLFFVVQNFDLTIYKFSSVLVLQFKLVFRLWRKVITYLILTTNQTTRGVSYRLYILLRYQSNYIKDKLPHLFLLYLR